jgi:ABC-type uncharacterized transport system substrate-binding protein
VTGVSWFAAESVSKLLEVLGKLVPNIARAVLLVNPYSPELAGQPETAQQAARALGWQLQFIEARSENEIDTAFADAQRQRADAVIVSTDPFFRNRHEQIVAQAGKEIRPIPSICAGAKCCSTPKMVRAAIIRRAFSS